MIVLPLASWICASVGIRVAEVGPTAIIFPRCTTSTPSLMTGPEIGMIVAPVYACGLSCACTVSAHSNATNIALIVFMISPRRADERDLPRRQSRERELTGNGV